MMKKNFDNFNQEELKNKIEEYLNYFDKDRRWKDKVEAEILSFEIDFDGTYLKIKKLDVKVDRAEIREHVFLPKDETPICINWRGIDDPAFKIFALIVRETGSPLLEANWKSLCKIIVNSKK